MSYLPSTPARADCINIDAWTDEATAALSAVHIAATAAAVTSPRPAGVRGTSVALDIPLDMEHFSPGSQRIQDRARESTGIAAASAATQFPTTYVPRRREPFRRDSLERREALLKGKEGSRRRQKWENDHLLGNPHAEPPLPSDWEIRPTYPVHSVPYILAPLWNERESQRKLEAARKVREAARPENKRAAVNVPRELRARLKRAKGAKSLLQDLEEQVREFVKAWDESRKEIVVVGKDDEDEIDAETDEEDDVVFVGRNKASADAGTKATQLQKDKMIFGSPADDNGSGFGRLLVHSIAAHYNLRTWSVTRGNPAMREAYVGIPEITGKSLRPGVDGYKLPRPLWVSL